MSQGSQKRIQYTTVKDLILGEFERKRLNNSRLSLRSYAKQLEITPSYLSMVLAGKRELSLDKIDNITKKLRFGPLQAEILKKNQFKNKIVNPEKLDEKYQELSLNEFELIADWYHFIILSLLDLPNSKFEAKWLSKKLGIEKERIQLAMSRLVDMGIVRQIKGKWQQVQRPLKLNNKVSNEATKKCYRSILKAASDSLEKNPLEVREHTGVTMSVSKDCIEIAKKKIKEFKREFTKTLSDCGEADSVYQLSIQFFPVADDKE